MDFVIEEKSYLQECHLIFTNNTQAIRMQKERQLRVVLNQVQVFLNVIEVKCDRKEAEHKLLQRGIIVVMSY